MQVFLACMFTDGLHLDTDAYIRLETAMRLGCLES
jgi:hypothetical protein